MKSKKSIRALDISYIGLFIALMAICSWISVPMVIPFTMQTFAVFATVLMLGTKRACVTVAIYIGLAGCAGVLQFRRRSRRVVWKCRRLYDGLSVFGAGDRGVD